MARVSPEALPRGERERPVTLWGDTGAAYTVLPPAPAEEVGVFRPGQRHRDRLADGRETEAEVGLASISLEGLGLRVDPTTGKLEPTRPFTTLAHPVAG